MLTTDGRLRLRVLLSGATTCLLLLTATGIATMNTGKMLSVADDGVHMDQLASLEPASGAALEVIDAQHDPVAAERLAAAQKRLQRYKRDDEDNTDTVEQASDEYAALAEMQTPVVENGPREDVLKIGKGDTLGGLLQRAGLSSQDAHNAVEAMKGHYNPRDLKIGQTVRLRYDQDAAGDRADGGNPGVHRPQDAP